MVENFLQELGLGSKPRLLVANKIDLLDSADDGAAPVKPRGLDPRRSVNVSAAKGWNLDKLLQKIKSKLMSVDGPLTVVTSAVGG